jgi:DNA-binding transcriptional LysR family regulator
MPPPVASPLALRIKTRQLVLLAHLDRERSVLAAADAAGMSQPAASKLLRELEQTLGVPLFERHARGVRPTPFGSVVLRHAHAVLAELQRTHEDIEAARRGGRLKVALGSVLGAATDLLPRALALLAARHPDVAVSVAMDTSREMVARLLAGQLDIVVGRILDAELAPQLVYEPLADEPHGLFAGPRHALGRRRRLRLEDLAAQPWVLPPVGSVLRDRVDALFLQQGLPAPDAVVETTSLPLITSLLRDNGMVVALPETVMRPACEAGMLRRLPVDLNLRMEGFGLVTRRGHPMSAHALAALAALRASARAVYARRR